MIEDDVLERAKAIANRLRRPFREVINEALRAGLETVEAPASRAYQTIPHKMRIKAGKNPNNIQELLAQLEGEDAR